jgi:hypothetical protein
MTQSSKNKIFTAADIERYHAGTLPAEEMHALEKAALDDPFLADALEGLALTPTPAADLESLHNRLAQRLEKKKTRALFATRRSWLNAAAILLVMVGGGWFYFKIMQPPAGDLALEKPNSAAYDKQTLDSSSTVTDSLVSPVTAPNTDMVYDKKEQLTPSAKAAIKAPVPDARQLNEPAALMRDSVSFKDMAKAEDKEIMHQSNATTSADTQIVTAMGIKRKSTGDTVKNVNVVMKPLNQPPSEEIVLGRGNKFIDRSRYQKVRVDTLEPAEGWVKFDDYVAANLQRPEERRAKPEPGEVQLAFDVNSEGEPVNITVVKSLCGKCDEEAIRLLKEGPRWKKKKKGKGTVTIRF